MAKQVNFSLVGSSLKVLTSLLAALCLFIGMLIYPFLVYADSAPTGSLIIVQFNDFGDSQSATALFNGQPIDSVNQCLPADGQPSLAGNVPPSANFTVDFYSSQDCTGDTTNSIQFTAPDGGGKVTITCDSDQECSSDQ
jgi:hypothetical protein